VANHIPFLTEGGSITRFMLKLIVSSPRSRLDLKRPPPSRRP
jgi:hypothetical protein